MCIFKIIIAVGIIIGGIVLEFLWLALCFGTVIIGVAILIFAPHILFLPFTFSSLKKKIFLIVSGFCTRN